MPGPEYIPNNNYVQKPDGSGYMLDPNKTFSTNTGSSWSGGASGLGGGLAALLSQMGRGGGMAKQRSAVSTYGQSPMLAAQQQTAQRPSAGAVDDGGMLGKAREQALADFMKAGGLNDIRNRPGMQF